MYKVMSVPGGWQVFWVENEDAQPRPVRVEPYKHRPSAYRKAKQLNDAAKIIDEIVAKDGAIIL
ncbi:MAG: hypothetical protein PVSMB2_36160 [Ktedonobacteraceae bacterium]